jgi:hypothetical protein
MLTYAGVSVRQHTTAYVSIRQLTSAYSYSMRSFSAASARASCVSICGHTSAYVSIYLQHALILSAERARLCVR